MKIGALINIGLNCDIDEKFNRLKALELESCQVCVWDTRVYTKDTADRLRKASEKYGIEISTLWAGWRGPATWNFYDGQYDLGLVPDEYRADRLSDLMAAAEFAGLLGVENMATHVGFMPENPGDER